MPTEIPPGALPQPVASCSLTQEETQMVLALGGVPDQYAVLMLPTSGMGLGIQAIPTKNGPVQCVVMQLMVVIPPSIVAPEGGAIIDPATNQPRVSKRLGELMVEGYPQLARALVRRSSLTPAAQANLGAQQEAMLLAYAEHEAREAARNAAGTLPPLPVFRGGLRDE